MIRPRSMYRQNGLRARMTRAMKSYVMGWPSEQACQSKWVFGAGAEQGEPHGQGTFSVVGHGPTLYNFGKGRVVSHQICACA